jgi:hypothetical protein
LAELADRGGLLQDRLGAPPTLTDRVENKNKTTIVQKLSGFVIVAQPSGIVDETGLQDADFPGSLISDLYGMI